ncbi:MAG TPA: hypothetical protein VEA19_02035, partial [Actinomycetota bacterium]|nr:hypothetical protein [Actinomycetota bacterium]
MTSTLATPLHLAAHLVTLFIALGAAIVAFRAEGKSYARPLAAAGLLSFAVAEALHGPGFVGEGDGSATAMRVAGLAVVGLLLLANQLERSPWLIGGVVVLLVSELLVGPAPGIPLHAARIAGVASLAIYVQRAARRSIRFRIMAGFVSVLLVVVLAISTAITQVIDRSQRTAALARLRGQAVETLAEVLPLVTNQAQGLGYVVQTVAQDLIAGQ